MRVVSTCGESAYGESGHECNDSGRMTLPFGDTERGEHSGCYLLVRSETTL
jgi:hypothetical protein